MELNEEVILDSYAKFQLNPCRNTKVTLFGGIRRKRRRKRTRRLMRTIRREVDDDP